MNKKLNNPFVTSGYMGAEYFCDRQQETNALLKAITSKRNIALISLRRMGKTGLLQHIKYKLTKEQKTYSVIYVDLLSTMNGNDLLNIISTSLLREKQHEKNIFEKLLKMLAKLRPKISYDQLTGQPSLELTVENQNDIQYGVNNLIEFMSDLKQDVVFMFDEFQQITNYPEKNIEQILRTVVQSNPNIVYIFSGSSKHMLEPMFNAPSRPFYQSTGLMYLDKINVQEYQGFIEDKFSSFDRKITPATLSKITEWTRLHTFYVQYICNLLFETEEFNVDENLLNKVLEKVLISYEPLFASYRNLIPMHQYKLLQSIAVENGIDKPTSGAFIQNYKLKSASSVKTSLNALYDKEMIINDNGYWLVYDVFFSRWLEYHYGGK